MKSKTRLAVLLATFLSVLPLSARAGDVCTATPDTVRRGNVEVVEFTGTNFTDTTAVSFGDARIAVLDFEGDASTLVVTLQVGQRALAGTRDLTATLEGAGTFVCTGALTVEPGPPALFQLSPDEVFRGDNQTIVVTGLNLDAVDDITIDDAVVTSAYAVAETDPTVASVDVAVAADAPAGAYDVVGVADGVDALLEDGFTVVPGPLAATSVSPTSIVRGETLTLTFEGANLDVVQSVSLGSGISVGGITVVTPSELSVVVSAQPESTPAGVARDITLSGGAESVMLEDSFTVEAGAASLTRVQPNRVIQGAEVELRLDGVNLDGVDTFAAGEGVTALAFDTLSPTRVLVTLEIAEDALPGSRDVTIEGTYGETTLVSGLRVVEAVVPDPRLNFPSVVDAGQVEIGARKRVSLLFINEVEVDEVVELEVVSGDINEFMIVDLTGETLDTFYPEALTFDLAALDERLIAIEYRPSLRSTALAEVQVIVRGEELGRVDLRGTGVASTLSFNPTPPILLPLVQEGEVGRRQVSTLASSQMPPEITDVVLLVEQNNAPFPEAGELTTVDLSDPLPPETRNLFGVTLITLETSYPVGVYEGEVWVMTNQSSAPIMPLSFTGTVTPAPPADEDEGDEPGDAGPDGGSDAGPDFGDGGFPDVADGGADGDQPDAGGDEDGGGGDEGCCAQAATTREPAETWLLALGLGLMAWLRRRR